jgi:hypothetical protein
MEAEVGINGFNLFVAISLFLSHLTTDFILQPTLWVEKKREFGLKSKYFWFHISLSALVPYVIIHNWNFWMIPAGIFISHAVIDYWKITRENKIAKSNAKNKKIKTTTHLFIIDQVLHVIVLIGLFLFITDIKISVLLRGVSCSDWLYILINITSILLLLSPSGILIGSLTEQFRKELNADDSLRKAGMYIGVFERLLVFAFVLLGQYGGIGFLLASKSILRIARDEEEAGRKKTEYVLIGTLISFSIAIVIGLFAKYLLQKI